jgi:hypothetical protein
MTYQWSDNSDHILSLYRPWTADDGYSTEELLKAEAAQRFAFPEALHRFYHDWGRHSDLAPFRVQIIHPADVQAIGEAVVFAKADQGTLYWAFPRLRVKHADPPVHYMCVDRPLAEAVRYKWWSTCHDHLSDFLDGLAYGHAFAGGALHGGMSQQQLDDSQLAMLKRRWPEITIHSSPRGVPPGPPTTWTIYGAPGQAIDIGRGVCAASAIADGLEEIQQALGLTWDVTW